MVLPAKIFKVKEKVNPEIAVQKLESFVEEETYKTEDGKTIALKTNILDLKLEKGSIYGVFSKDFVGEREYRRKLVEYSTTKEGPFWIRNFGDEPTLVVMAPSGGKKLLSGYIANKISQILFGTIGVIVEGRITHETLRTLHESNPQATKLIWFDDIDIPGIEKLCLAGSDVGDTEYYRNDLQHGKIWYVVFKAQKSGLVVGVTRDCGVTLFSRSSAADFIDYLYTDLMAFVE